MTFGIVGTMLAVTLQLSSLHCTAAKFVVSKPAPAFTVYSLLPKSDAAKMAEERTLGPYALAPAPGVGIAFSLPGSRAIGLARAGNLQRCTVPSSFGADRDAQLRAFAQVTGVVPAFAPAVKAALPAGASAFTKAVAPDGTLWFTMEYAGMHGNPTGAGTLGHVDTAGKLHVYHVPGDANQVSMTVARDGTVWLGDYYNERVIAVDPAKL